MQLSLILSWRTFLAGKGIAAQIFHSMGSGSTPHLTVVTLPLPLLVAVSAWVDVFGTWVRPKGAGGP